MSGDDPREARHFDRGQCDPAIESPRFWKIVSRLITYGVQWLIGRAGQSDIPDVVIDGE